MKYSFLTAKLRVRFLLIALSLVIVLGLSTRFAVGDSTATIRNLQPFRDANGQIATFSVNGDINTNNNAFFQSLGTNGRSCASCHVVSQAWGLSVKGVRARFESSDGTDPLFASIDGANCPDAKTGDRADHSLLLNNGLIRIFLPVPTGAQFGIKVISDPYGCAMVTDPNTKQEIVSVYRRPQPDTNLHFLSTVMFDGRETVAPLNNGPTFMSNLVTDLTHQVTDAILGHAQASTPPTSAQVSEIVNFELGLFTAQIYDNAAGRLDAHGATGGPSNLANQLYYPGINDSLGSDPTGAKFNPVVFSLFQPWLNLGRGQNDRGEDDTAEARRAIARGEQIFNTFPLTISNVRGLNDNPALSNPTSFTGTCSTCHDTPNVGNHSFPLPLDIGTSHSTDYEHDANIRAALTQLSSPNLPIYEIIGCIDPFNAGQPASFFTTDPGKALITGQCSDFNRGKGPILRGLVARAPYFHNGSAADFKQLVNFYDLRFQMGLTKEQKTDLIAFLNSL